MSDAVNPMKAVRRALLPFQLNTITLACLSLGISSTAIVQAEEMQAAKEKAVERISVVASPIRSSQEQSIQLQRDATNVINVIAADDIGRFPDQTAAAALARLPAVAVQRDQGQERYIQVRGAPARWTVVAFDGVNVLGAEERVFRFDSVPAALMSEVDVAKTLTAEMPSEAVAGRVNIKTFSPLSKPGFSSDFDLGLGKNQLGDGDQERYSARLSWSDGTFGVMAAASAYSNEQITDNNETSWDENGAPSRFDFRNYQLERETNSAALKLEYAPSERSKYTLSSLYTEFLDHELRNQYQFNLASGRGERNAESGSLLAVPMTALFQDGDYENSTWVNTLAGEHETADWRWNWHANYTETDSLVDLPILRRSQTRPDQFHSLTYDMSNPQIPFVQLYQTQVNADRSLSRGPAMSALNQTGFGFDGLIYYSGKSSTESVALKLDASHDWQHAGADAVMKFGVQADQRDAGSPGSGLPFIMLGPLAQAAGIAFTPNQFNTDQVWNSDQNYGFSANYYDNTAARQHIEQVMQGLTAAGLVNPASFLTADSSYQVNEDIVSVYGMNTWNWQQHQVLVGLRAEQVKLNSAGFIASAKSTEALEVSRSDTELFPSVHWNVELTDEVKFRLAGVTGSSRPSFSQVRAGATISDPDQSVSGGNPYLKDEKAVGLDSALEWYFADASLAAVNLFHRSLDNVLFSSVTTVGDDRFNTADFNRSGYDYSTTLNGGSGHLTGLELSYIQQWDFLPESIRGFGLQFNYAFLDSEFTTPDGRKVALPGTSDQVMNSSLFYENHDWSVRLNYQWRDQWLDDISPDASDDIYWADTERVDLSVRYQLTKQVSVYADLNNLTDESGIRFSGDESKPVEVEGFGRRYLAGVRVSF